MAATVCIKCRTNPKLDGQRYCRQCMTAFAKSWRKKNPEKVQAAKELRKVIDEQRDILFQRSVIPGSVQ